MLAPWVTAFDQGHADGRCRGLTAVRRAALARVLAQKTHSAADSKKVPLTKTGAMHSHMAGLRRGLVPARGNTGPTGTAAWAAHTADV